MRETLKLGLGVIVALILTGCASDRVRYRSSMPLSAPLDSAARVYVSVPQDGLYNLQRYEYSGVATAFALGEAARGRFAGVDVGNEFQSDQQAREAAGRFKARYVIAPMILHWEDRATAWSGLPDK